MGLLDELTKNIADIGRELNQNNGQQQRGGARQGQQSGGLLDELGRTISGLGQNAGQRGGFEQQQGGFGQQ